VLSILGTCGYLLPGCPLALWSLEAFKEIGNAIGKFLHVDSKLLSGLDRRMGKLLVEVDTNGGLWPIWKLFGGGR
jgi:hypothetical protein